MMPQPCNLVKKVGFFFSAKKIILIQLTVSSSSFQIVFMTSRAWLKLSSKYSVHFVEIYGRKM